MERTIEDRLIYNNNKLVADKIRKTLLNIRNIPGISAKRWIWEMIQNAKDVPNNFSKVDIKIELLKSANLNYLIFSHNGSYFSIDNVLGILQQVSSKDSTNAEDQTGKFGTGFIGTHLLSTKIKVKGIVKYKGIYRKFDINLNRSAESSEELLKEVSNSIIEFKNKMNDVKTGYEILSTYNQKQNDFDTCFEYKLENAQALKIAKEGINDLINTAPVTLATQCKKISSIVIKNEIDNEERKYTISSRKKQKNIFLYTSTISSNKNGEIKNYFFSYETDNICRLLCQVEPKDSSYDIVEIKNDQPILLRDFPLIGSENFHFPFYLDGFKFNPLETRNGLFLNGNLNQEAIDNRKILEEAIKAAIEFSKYIISQTKNKLYCLAKTKIPEPPIKYDKCAIEWFISQQKKWRKELINLTLLRDDENSYSQLKELKLPQFNKKFNKDFYELLKLINLTEGIIPHEDDIFHWYDIMEKDSLKEVYEINENTWGFNYMFTEEDLFSKIEKYQNITKFAEDFQKSSGEILNWLNNLYELLNKNNFKDCLNKYKLIPNQKGFFMKANEIFGNDNNNEDKIPPIINQIYKYISKDGKELYDIIIHEEIKLINFDKFVEKKNLNDIFNEFSNFFKEEKNDIKKKEYLCNKFINFSINNDKIKQMFDFRKDIEPINDYIKKEILTYYNEGHNLWKFVEDFWFEYHSKIVEKIGNIETLSKKLYNNKIRREEETYIWLNKYITFYKDNSTIVEKKKIFPDKNGNFNFLNKLHSATDVPEILIDYYNELKNIREKGYDKRNYLLSNKIEIYKGHDKLSQKEIISDIETLFNSAEDGEIKMKISEKIMSLLPKKDSTKFKTIKVALKNFIKFYNIIFNKNIVPKEEDITACLDYGIFVSYILDKIFRKIELMNDNEISSHINLIPKIIKYSWDYQYNNDFRVNTDPKEYKIFVNQYNQQKYIQEINIKKNFNNLKYTELENQLFNISKSPFVDKDYKNLFLSYSFDKELQEKYAGNFHQIEFLDMCKYIDGKITSYREYSYSLAGEGHKQYRELFFKLNDIFINNPELRKNFPDFTIKKGQISIKFLVNDDKGMDKFVDDIKNIINQKENKNLK